MSEFNIKFNNAKYGNTDVKQSKQVSSFSPEQKAKLAKAAKDFETMMSSMMLKSMFEANGGMFGEETESGAQMFDGVFTQELAGKLSGSNNMGIAQKIYSQMTGEQLPDNQFYRRMNELSNEIKNIQSTNNNTSFNSDPLQIVNSSGLKVKPSESSLTKINKYDDIINTASEKFGVDKNLIKSVIIAESAGNKNAVSSAKAKGLMQLMDSTASNMGVTNSFDPNQNIMGGTKYLSVLLKQYDGDLKKTVAAYNAGPGNVDKYNGIPPFRETKNYVNRVLSYYNHFDGAENENI